MCIWVRVSKRQQFDQLLSDYANDPNLVKGVLLAGEVYYLKGQADFSRGKPAEANELFDQAIALLDTIPSEAEAHDRSLACYMKGLSCWYRGDFFESAAGFMESLDLFPNHPHAGATCRLVSDCYVRLKEAGAVDPNEADPIIEWGYRTVFEDYPDHRDVEFAAAQLARFYLAQGRPASAGVYLNWLVDLALEDPSKSGIVNRLVKGMEVCGQ